MKHVKVVMDQAEAQSLADVSRQWRGGYQPDPLQEQALTALRQASVAARRAKTPHAEVVLRREVAQALLTVERGLRNNVRLNDNQRAALMLVRYTLIG